MHIGEIKTADCANGIGMRVTIFVSGCTNHCKGCFQPETWDFNYGKEWTQDHENHVLKELSHSYHSGLTILGGEPFEPSNQAELVKLIRRIRAELPSKNIWMFTGNIYERDLLPGGKKHTDVTDEILDNIDVLVDGPFMHDKKSLMLKFRGSHNQRIIDMPKTREAGEVILLDL